MKDLKDIKIENYSKARRAKAMARLQYDMLNPIPPTPEPAKPAGISIPFIMFALMLILAVVLLLTASGCNTIAGAAADIEAAARGTQDYLSQGVENNNTGDRQRGF